MVKRKEVTDATFRNASAREKPYKVHDVRGLFMLVNPNGSKWWRLRYTLAGKDALMSLGTYPDVSLVGARKGRDAARVLIAQGLNPVHARRVEDAERTAGTFASLLEEWIETRRPDWAPSNLDKINELAANNLTPYLRDRPVRDVRPHELLAVLRRVESRNALDLAQRCASILKQVFALALGSGRSETNPALGLGGLLKKPQTRNRAAITNAAEVPALMRNIEGYHGGPVVRAALKLSALTFLRPGELRQCQWKDVNLDKGELNVPIAIRKLKTLEKRKASTLPHWVPLSDQALTVLRDLHPLTGRYPYIFPGERSPGTRPMSDGAVLAALRTMGYGTEAMSAHGFRAMARTLLAELGWKPDAIERQLAHKASGPLGAAYDRAQFLDERRQMMQAWADYLDGLNRGNVVAGNFGRAA